ncbi:MAG: tRNA (adenosine(37)-N6)-dimethylallyltransferase MiaA [Nitratireductor sp.]
MLDDLNFNVDAVLLAGPTASGKTSLAIEIARQHNGVIINSDSMQVYDVLSLLTARPQEHEMQNIEHFLFGHVDPSTHYSTAKWIEDVKTTLDDVKAKNKLPIFAGGTGLYFKTLLEGLSPVPAIDDAIRHKWRVFSQTAEPNELHDTLKEMDAQSAATLLPSDTQRLVRAIEVFESTGKPLHYWQSLGNETPLLDSARVTKMVLLPEREILRERAALRFDQMIEEGALREVEALMRLDLSNDMPAMRAIGVSQLIAHLKNEMSLEQACELSVNATRQYAKRQTTWLKNQFGDDWHRI